MSETKRQGDERDKVKIARGLLCNHARVQVFACVCERHILKETETYCVPAPERVVKQSWSCPRGRRGCVLLFFCFSFWASYRALCVYLCFRCSGRQRLLWTGKL